MHLCPRTLKKVPHIHGSIYISLRYCRSASRLLDFCGKTKRQLRGKTKRRVKGIFSELHLKYEKQICPKLLFASLTNNEVDSHCSHGFFRHHGLYHWSATKALLHKNIIWTPSIGHHGPSGVHGPQLRSRALEQSETEWLCVDITGYTIVNVYKPPRSRFTPTAIPTFPHPALHVSDFKWQYVNWSYNRTSPDGERLDSQATSNNLGLLYYQRETATASLTDGTSAPTQIWPSRVSARTADCRQTCPWKVPADTISALPHNAIKTQGSWPQRSGEALELSQSDWKRFCLLTGESVERLPPPDTSNI